MGGAARFWRRGGNRPRPGFPPEGETGKGGFRFLAAAGYPPARHASIRCLPRLLRSHYSHSKPRIPWIVKRVDRKGTGGQSIQVFGVSQIVRHKEARFLSEIEGKSITVLAVVRGGTPLMAAAYVGNASAARLLLDHGTKVDTKNFFGKTALDLATIGGKKDVADLLRSHGAKQPLLLPRFLRYWFPPRQ